jgi:arginase family enzyme
MYVGIRDCDPPEVDVINRFKVPVLNNFDSEANQLLYKEFAGNEPIWVSLDVDALDSRVIRATGTPVANGLSIA